MTAPRLLVLQLSDQDPPARLGEWLAAAGAELDVVDASRQSVPSGLDEYQGVVCLGGAMNANDDDTYPWLVDVRRALGEAVTARVPVLAVCLGAQLLASACGGTVAAGTAGPEIGPGLVAKRDTAWGDPLFGELPLMPDVLQFHQDVVERLPGRAVVLATSTRYPNQAFRIGGNAYGLQFHIETTTETVLAWASSAGEITAAARPGDLTEERLDELHADLADVWQPFTERFVKLTTGELRPADSPRNTLPLV